MSQAVAAVVCTVGDLVPMFAPLLHASASSACISMTGGFNTTCSLVREIRVYKRANTVLCISRLDVDLSMPKQQSKSHKRAVVAKACMMGTHRTGNAGFTMYVS